MKIDCISDLHGYLPDLPGGDLLILAGDYTATDKLYQWSEFFEWMNKHPYEKKILVAGNHDGFLESGFPKTQKESDDLKDVQSWLEIFEDFEYLCDSGTEYKGLKIWGTPWTPWFQGVNPKCRYFMDNEIYLEKKFELIPKNLDILITHGPMLHILDANKDGYHCGSKRLRDHIDRAQPRFHIFGHIHERGQQQLMYKHEGKNTWCVNCSYVNEYYKPVFSHVRLEI